MHRKAERDEYKKQFKALQMAEEALEKQIPKRVELTDDCCFCPRCHFDMMGVYDFPDNADDPAYCPACGQKLNWEVEE